MLTCKEATRMMSEAQDRPLEVGDQLRVQMDFLRTACRRYLGRRGSEENDSRIP